MSSWQFKWEKLENQKQNGFPVVPYLQGVPQTRGRKGCGISRLPVKLGTQQLAWVMKHGQWSPATSECGLLTGPQLYT